MAEPSAIVSPKLSAQPDVRVVGAREHNLQDVDLAVPRDATVVFTGVSGSGKSSLAFGTLYAESQRRYLESVAPYASEDFPEPDTPVKTTVASRGTVRSTSCRLCSRAPRTRTSGCTESLGGTNEEDSTMVEC